jgi:tRNA (guanine-N7-)-methyltransferase
MSFSALKLKDPEKNHYVKKLHGHPGLITNRNDLWSHFRNRRAIVDLGCGNGHFLEAYLKLHPEHSGLGVDRRFKRLFKAASKIQKINESKVFFGDVIEFVEASPSSFWEEIWMMFPDPWPKKKHSRNRMISSKLFYQIHRILKPDGRFSLITDHLPYWDFFIDFNYKIRLFPISRAAQGDLFGQQHTSLFQRRFESIGSPIYSLEMRK